MKSVRIASGVPFPALALEDLSIGYGAPRGTVLAGLGVTFAPWQLRVRAGA